VIGKSDPELYNSRAWTSVSGIFLGDSILIEPLRITPRIHAIVLIRHLFKVTGFSCQKELISGQIDGLDANPGNHLEGLVSRYHFQAQATT
jgi:hypothetical protein